MKAFKKNAVIITVMLFVCVAVYLNWSYDKKTAAIEENTAVTQETGEMLSPLAEEAAETERTTQETNEAGLYYTLADEKATVKENTELSEYFAAVRLQRSQARDEAASTLEAVATSEGASQETIDTALKKMTQIADWAVKESELESLIASKGFTDCVVYLSEDGVSVTVAAEEGLSSVSVAKITDIILSETDFTADDLRVIEIK